METTVSALLAVISSLTSFSTAPISGPDTKHYALSLKTLFHHFPRRIAADAHNFTYLVHHSDLFIDKTLILNEMLKSREQIVAIELPHKWGKSIVLEMTKTFLEIQVNQDGVRIPQNESINYVLFKDGLIPQPDNQIEKFEELFLVTKKYPKYLETHCAQFPVIFVQFESVNITTEDSLYKTVAACISQAFKRHSYIEKVLKGTTKKDPIMKIDSKEAQSYLEKYRRYSQGRANVTELTDSLLVLGEILHSIFNKSVFVLIDDFDIVLNNVQPDPQPIRGYLSKFLEEFYATLMTRTFQQNAYLEKGIMIGTFRMEKLLPKFDNFAIYKGINNIFFRLAGFTENEVQTLLNYFDITKKNQTKVKDWYGKYKRHFADLTSLYCPNSVAHYVNTRQFANYRTPVDNFFVRNLLKNDATRELMMELLEGKRLEFLYKPVNYTDITLFQEIIHLPHHRLKLSSKVFQLIYSYLFDAGYLRTYDNTHNYGYCAVLANEEIRNVIITELMGFYIPKYNVSTTLLENAVHSLAEFIKNDARVSKNLADSLQPLIGDMKSPIARLVIHFLASRITMLYDLRLKEVNREVEGLKPNGILYSNVSGSIVHVALGADSMDEVMKEAKQFEYELKHFRKVKNIKFIAINVPSTGAMDIRAEMF